LLAAGMLFLALLSCHEHRRWRLFSPPLHALGNVAFFIYFAHLMSFTPIQAAMDAIPSLGNRWLYVLVLSIASFAVCALVAFPARRLPRKVQTLLLGL
jgi:membrane-bound acyltransferase YfiQ involved in biofilm formation